MTVEKRYKKRYKSGDTPWDAGKPDFNLIETVNENNILSCKALDIGCGTGDNSIWLAQNGFQVTGTDVSAPRFDFQETEHLFFFVHFSNNYEILSIFGD